MTSTERTVQNSISIPGPQITLNGILSVPSQAIGVVLFVHGSGSSRLSPRNQYVASVLNRARIATLLFDLLTNKEEGIDEYNRAYRFDIELLTSRLLLATDWILREAETKDLGIGYFGASTGAAAALVAAAKGPKLIKAVVSRGGRPDMAGEYLSAVKAPTLLIVGGNDETVIDLNQQAAEQLICTKKLEIVPHATHLFEEPGTLEKVAVLAEHWFSHYLSEAKYAR